MSARSAAAATSALPIPRAAILAMILLFLGAVAVALALGNRSPLGSTRLTDSDSGSVVGVDAGQTVTVVLESNPSTGYGWTARPATGVDLVSGPVYTAGNARAVGAPGTEAFTFKVTGSGDIPLRLEYRRPFEPNEPPARTFNVTLRAVRR